MTVTATSKKRYFLLSADNEAQAERIRERLDGLSYTETDAVGVIWINEAREGKPRPISFD